MSLGNIKDEVIQLLLELIKTPSISRSEDNTANIIDQFLKQKGYSPQRLKNNVIVRSSNVDENKPTILLNSHHDTVKATEAWSKDPFNPTMEDGKIYGLGSNDAGASLVSLLATFLFLEPSNRRKYNLIFAASAEEEVSGADGAAEIVKSIGDVDLGIVGEPTQMQMAVAEKGLMVLDCTAYGKSGHAARDEGVNAIYEALTDINWFKDFEFAEKSELLGPVKMTVSVIEAGYQHNVVPDRCTFVVDVRTNERYTNEEVFDIINKNTTSEIKARSFRLNSSFIELDHPIVKRGLDMGLTYYGSPTMSDQVFMKGFPTLKIGPGDSSRSHTADEYIYVSEIQKGIDIYINIIESLEIEKVRGEL